MYDVPASLLQVVYRALDEDVGWRETFADVADGFGAHEGALGLCERREDHQVDYTRLADVGLARMDDVTPDALPGEGTTDGSPASGLAQRTFVETREVASDGSSEVRVRRDLDETACVLLELRRHEPFGDGDCRQICILTEHLARVVRTRRELQQIRAVELGRAAALNVLRVPAALVDQDCVLLAKNALFEQVLERGMLEIGADNRIRTTPSRLSERLHANVGSLARARLTGADEYAADLSVVLDARPHHRTTVVGRHADPDNDVGSHVLLSVYHPDADHRIDAGLLEQLYDFTPTEAQTAARLAEGYTIDEIADYRRCARSTVRTHVKRILRKTGTHRQAELVRVILGSPAAKLTAWGA